MVELELVFFALFGVVLLNLAAAGVAAWLAIRTRITSRMRRASWASGLTGVTTALMFLGFVLRDGEVAGNAWVGTAVLALILLVSAVCSLPGAWVMSRLAERPPGIGDTFA